MALEDYEQDEWVEDEADGDSAADLLICPACRGSVHEETQQCPHCGDWITPVYPVRSMRRFVWIALVAALVASMAGLVAIL